MTRKPFRIGEGDPNENPFGDDLAYQLAVDLPLSEGEPIVFADIETTTSEHHSLQQSIWRFNAEHRNLSWAFRTRHFESINGQHDIVRIWKTEREGIQNEN